VTDFENMKEMQGYLLITAASILWGTLGILAKLSFEHGVLPETLIALRLVISFATLSVVLAVFSKDSFKVKKTDALLFLIFGVFATALQRISYFYAVDLTTATVAAILFYTYPVFVTISASFFLKEKITSRELLAIILTFSGAALVVRAYDASSLKVNLVGIVFGLLSSLLFTLYFMITKKLRNRYTSWTLTLYGDGIGVLTLTPVISLSIPQITNFPLQLWLLIFTIAWIPSLLAYLLYSYALKYVKASKGSILSVIEPLSATLFSTIFIGENLENPQIIGIALALIGVVLLFRMKQKRITRESE
jgi:drug/metabolite transporter (DMT)-like permease